MYKLFIGLNIYYYKLYDNRVFVFLLIFFNEGKNSNNHHIVLEK